MPKRKKTKKKPMQSWKSYVIQGNKLERKNKFCPKCGTRYFLAAHKNRETCGKCGYTDFKK